MKKLSKRCFSDLLAESGARSRSIECTDEDRDFEVPVILGSFTESGGGK